VDSLTRLGLLADCLLSASNGRQRKESTMKIIVTARHFDLNENLNTYANNEIKRLEKYFDHIIESHLTMSIEKNRQIADLSAKVYGTVLTSKAKTYDMYIAIEQVVSKMESQIKKYKSKLKDKKAVRKDPPKTRPVASQAESDDEEPEY
jgi:putative sigma-54 modulation protein